MLLIFLKWTSFLQNCIICNFFRRSGHLVGGDSPLSSFSTHSKLDWSPGEIIPRTQSTEMSVTVSDTYRIFFISFIVYYL